MKKSILILTFILLSGWSMAQTNNAYGNNQKQVEPGVFAIYSGDINQDGVVDIVDQITMDNDLSIFAAGYVLTDLNGDSVVDILDQIILDNNIAAFVAVLSPANGNRIMNTGNEDGKAGTQNATN